MVLERIRKWIFVIVMLAFIVGVCIWGLSGCNGKEEAQSAAKPAAPAPQEKARPASGSTKSGDPSTVYKSGPDDAKVKVVAYYPGGHEETIAAVKRLKDKFPGKVQVEVVDWRTEEGFKRRQKTGLTCAGILINGNYIHKVKTGDKEREVLFTRRMDWEWTEEELITAVKQEIDKAEEKAPAQKEKTEEKDKAGK